MGASNRRLSSVVTVIREKLRIAKLWCGRAAVEGKWRLLGFLGRHVKPDPRKQMTNTRRTWSRRNVGVKSRSFIGLKQRHLYRQTNQKNNYEIDFLGECPAYLLQHDLANDFETIRLSAIGLWRRNHFPRANEQVEVEWIVLSWFVTDHRSIQIKLQHEMTSL